MATESVQYTLKDGVALLRLDDGKVNAVSSEVARALAAAFDRAEKEAGSVLLIGRPGRFSAGFDLRSMTDPESVRSLVGAGAELAMQIFTFPRPVVAACTGHAIAMGALLLLASDLRIGADLDAKLGLNEVAKGMGVPLFLVELARHRLSRRHLSRAMLMSEMYTPAEAVDAGFLDRVVPEPELEDTAFAEAVRLAQLPDPAFRMAKQRERAELAARIRSTLSEDMQTMTGSRSG